MWNRSWEIWNLFLQYSFWLLNVRMKFVLRPPYTTELKSWLPGTETKECRELVKYRVMYDISKNILRKYSNTYHWYFLNTCLEMSYIILYLANSWQFLVPVPAGTSVPSCTEAFIDIAYWISLTCATHLCRSFVGGAPVRLRTPSREVFKIQHLQLSIDLVTTDENRFSFG